MFSFMLSIIIIIIHISVKHGMYTTDQRFVRILFFFSFFFYKNKTLKLWNITTI